MFDELQHEADAGQPKDRELEISQLSDPAPARDADQKADRHRAQGRHEHRRYCRRERLRPLAAVVSRGASRDE